MTKTKDILMEKLRDALPMTRGEQLRLVFLLSTPSILAQLCMIMMQYIDASMVGHLGAGPAASIGLVSTTTWIFGGFCMATSSGFSVQVAHLVGAKDFTRARDVLAQGLFCVFVFSLMMGLLGLSIATPLPHWLGGNDGICADSADYFLIYSAFMPAMGVAACCSGMLLASGDMKTPAILNMLMCAMDVGFNYLFIYVLGMGVKGAALGTGLAETVVALLMLLFLLVRSPELGLVRNRQRFHLSGDTIRTALGITSPMWLQNIIMRGAHVCSTVIVAPLGTVAIAANAFAITAESICYMPGYGVEEAATTLVGQSIGARRKDMARSFALISTGYAAFVVSILAVLMYIFAPQMMGLLSNDPDVVALGVKCLRLEAFAETFYAVSMGAYGSCVGAGDTLVPSILNFGSMWVVRIVLALILVPHFGLMGYWIAMCIELNVRGIIFLKRILGRRWLERNIFIEKQIQTEKQV